MRKSRQLVRDSGTDRQIGGFSDKLTQVDVCGVFLKCFRQYFIHAGL